MLLFPCLITLTLCVRLCVWSFNDVRQKIFSYFDSLKQIQKSNTCNDDEIKGILIIASCDIKILDVYIILTVACLCCLLFRSYHPAKRRGFLSHAAFRLWTGRLVLFYVVYGFPFTKNRDLGKFYFFLLFYGRQVGLRQNVRIRRSLGRHFGC